ncbi:MAG: hypothetical protein LUC51_04830, partial [Cloacibacillus porcorum]|nr:hypothetical protein [Cloacibacillus porcorum]
DAGSIRGIGFLASQQQPCQHPPAVYRPLEGPKPCFTLGTVYRKENVSPVVMTFKKISEEVGKRAC